MKRKKDKPKMATPGFEGAVERITTVRISRHRTESRIVRCRPGTFEWRYGRKTADAALYHAGCHFADLWEKAGAASAKSIDWGRAGGSDWKGLPDGRAVAMAKLRGAMSAFGADPASRLIAYCVKGWTTAQIAATHRVSEREMAPVLHSDLRSCARFFKFIGGSAS